MTLLSPPFLSTAPSVTVADLVYFQQHETHAWIRIGHTGGNGRREERQESYEPVAVIQGSHADEDALHNLFAADRVPNRKTKSTYQGDRVHDYVSWLLNRGFAGRNRALAETLPALPFTVWSPEAQRNEHRNGQLSIEAAMPPRDRVSFARSDLAQLSSESDDWYTPKELIEAARDAMGCIDLDPASCIAANRVVGASQYYTKAIDGLRTDLPWEGNIWLNPPYGRGDSSAGAFTGRLIREFCRGNVSQAITCLNLNSSSTQWFQPIWDHAAAHVICHGRPNYWREDNADSAPTKGTICSYFGNRADDFARSFAHVGRIVILKQLEAAS